MIAHTRFRLSATLIPLLLMSLTALELLAQDAGRFARWAWEDGVVLGSHAITLAPVVLAAGGLVVPAGEHFDEAVLERVQSGYRGTWADYLNVANEFGSRYTWIPAASVFGVSLVTGDERFQDAAFTSVQTLLASVAITAVAKEVIGRPRPEAGRGSLRLRPFSGNVSFPSGHTTVAFAVVTPWVFYYPGPLTYSLFALSASTGLARIAMDKHWPTDVLAGAAVGFLTGRWLSKRHIEGSVDRPSIQALVSFDAVRLVVRLP